MIIVLGQIEVEAQDCAAAEDLMSEVTRQTRLEAGCLHYAYARDLVTPTRFQLSELWADEESLKAHLQTAHTFTYREGIGKLQVLSRNVKKYDASNERGL